MVLLRVLIPLVYARQRRAAHDEELNHGEKTPRRRASHGLGSSNSPPDGVDTTGDIMDITALDEAAASPTSNFRWSPLFAGVVIPFSILLEVPGLTEHWYIKTEANKIVDIQGNPTILDVGLGLSMASAVAANLCLLARFMERRVKAMTLLCIIFLSIHDIINVIAITIFGVEHRFDDGYTYGQAFWITVCSTATSMITNITLITDYKRTSSFAEKGSGLTRKQRSLIIVIMVFLIYAALASLVNAFILDREFIEALYFTLVTILTVGFGDIYTTSAGGRVWTCAFAAVGIVVLGVTVGMLSDAVMEALELAYRRRVGHVRVLRRQGEKRRRMEGRWRKAVEGRLKEKREPVWTREGGERVVMDGGGIWRRRKGAEERGLRLNVQALTVQEREECAHEAGIPVSAISQTLGGPTQGDTNLALEKSYVNSYEDYNEGLEAEKRKHFVAKFTSAWSLFIVFWLVGSAIFMVTEGWTYGEAMYFCFIAFSTIGYGDFTIKTPAGRAVFVFWALLGVPAMTVLIAVVVDAFSSKYKSALRTHAFDKAVKRYRRKKLSRARQQQHLARAPPSASSIPARPRSAQNHPRADSAAALRAARAQLEALPREILGHARELDERARYFAATARAEPGASSALGGGGDVEAGERDGPGRGLPESLAKLVEDVAEVGELADKVKRGMAQDAEMRQTLFMLSVEEALHKMIQAAERSLKVLSEHDLAGQATPRTPAGERQEG